ncbi:MAG: hypothetical protein HOI47_09855 [Candidatus Scalindua sp.]|jgi:hypothetical protein|nr:hypothetical protein [Candidatus Scalindua sp.]MBT6226948.1 hypothetical protein [Candidatus Scalindua sp.]
MKSIKIVLGTIVVVGTLMQGIELYYAPDIILLESSRQYPEYLYWIRWIITFIAVVGFFAVDFLKNIITKLLSRRILFMSDKFSTLSDFDLKQTEINPEDIKKYTSEDDFMFLAVDLGKEILEYTSILAFSYRLDDKNLPRTWKRNEAIIGGLLVRLSKLQNSILDTVCEKREEIALILLRSAIETAINCEFLIKNDSDELYDEYVKYSLREEKKLLNIINKGVEERGHETPWETRMRTLIMKAFKRSEVNPEEVDESNRKPWGKSIYQRAKDVGHDKAYLVIFSLPSHTVHGNWQDLLEFHLEGDGEYFKPSSGYGHPRPSLLLGLSLLSANVCQTFLEHIMPECPDSEVLEKNLTDFDRRIHLLSDLHEKFMQKGKE